MTLADLLNQATPVGLRADDEEYGRWVSAQMKLHELAPRHGPANPGCVNPTHLEPVTAGENSLRGDGPAAVNARKTYCKRGHALSPENTYIVPSSGYRQCRTCRRARWEARNGRLLAERRLAKAGETHERGYLYDDDVESDK